MTPNMQDPLKPEGIGACHVGWGLALNTLLTPLFPFPETNIFTVHALQQLVSKNKASL